jgi:DNA-binding response OmpR family regulator
MAIVLVVEDEPQIALGLCDLISGALGANVVVATSIATAQDYLRFDLDFAILDIDLSPETSFELARQLIDQQVPFAFATRINREELPLDLREAPFLSKPIVSSAVVETVHAGVVERAVLRLRESRLKSGAGTV